jgi:hypothetical protein
MGKTKELLDLDVDYDIVRNDEAEKNISYLEYCHQRRLNTLFQSFDKYYKSKI